MHALDVDGIGIRLRTLGEESVCSLHLGQEGLNAVQDWKEEALEGSHVT